jgi:hypothetical protein
MVDLKKKDLNKDFQDNGLKASPPARLTSVPIEFWGPATKMCLHRLAKKMSALFRTQ